jgi:uncharacterized protein (TIGR03083 family)
MRKPDPIIVRDLFPETLDELILLLSSLSEDEWQRPTACSEWSVKDIALHLLGGKASLLSRKRDGFAPGSHINDWRELVEFINNLNDTWVKATRRLSSRVLCDLLRFTGTEVSEYFATLDPFATGGPVNWAGDGPAPVWLDIAREYTEWWHHQQQIRDAVGKPGLKQPRHFAPVLDTFVRALPHTYRNTDADEGTLFALTISGDSGGQWFILRERGEWNLYRDHERGRTEHGQGGRQEPAAEIVIDEDLAWRLFTKGVTPEEARTRATVRGDMRLALTFFGTVSVIA